MKEFPQLTAEQYMEHYSGNNIRASLEKPKHQERLQRCVQPLRGGCGAGRFVDVGCALGDATAMMRDLLDGFWVGVDFCASSIAEAGSLHPDLPFEYVPDIDSLWSIEPFNFDGAVCTEVLEHVPDPALLVRQVMSIAPLAVFTTPNRFIVEPGHVRVFNQAMLVELFKNYDHEIESHGDFWYITARRKTLPEA